MTMRASLSALLLVLALAAFPRLAEARPWKGIEPGKSDKSEVLKKFGQPQGRKEKNGKTVFRYAGEQAIDEHVALFNFDEKNIVREIHVFPPKSPPVDQDTILASYGKGYLQKLTDDLQVYWWYPKGGLVVFFTPKGVVDVFIFKEPELAEKPAAKDEAKKGAESDAR